LSLVAAGLGAFGYWGLFTYYERKEFDEMAGIYPGIALLISVILFLICLILSVIVFLKSKKNRAV